MNCRCYSFAGLGRFCLVLSFLFLAACGESSTARSSPTIESPTATDPSRDATLSATLFPEPTLTVTSPVPRPLVTATPSPTLDAVATIVGTGEAKVIQSDPSPDGLWRVDIITYPCAGIRGGGTQRVEQLKLIDVGRGSESIVRTQMLTCEGALGAYGLGSLFWSPDSRIFYYTDAREGVPDGGGSYCWDRPLWTLDVADATTERLAEMWARADDGWIARWQDDSLVLQGPDRENTQRTPLYLPGAVVCQILWSPEGGEAVYLQASQPFEPGHVVLVRVYRTGEPLRVLLELDAAAFITASWATPKLIKLSGMQGGVLQEWTVENN